MAMVCIRGGECCGCMECELQWWQEDERGSVYIIDFEGEEE